MAALGRVQVLLLWAGIIALTFYPPTTEAQTTPPPCFLKHSGLVQPKPTGLPAKIEPEFPPECRNYFVVYTCSEPGRVSVSLSDVEPYTDYNCTGLLGNNIKTPLPPVQIKIDCNLNINYSHHATNTSIDLDWTTTSQNCGGVLQNLTKLSTECSCATSVKKQVINLPQPDEGSCKFNGLQPFTEYTCEIQPLYKNKSVPGQKIMKLKTEPGAPDRVPFYLTAPESNLIIVHYNGNDELHDFKGPERIFRAHLVGHKELNGTSCYFEFKDLSYLTSYTLEVVAFNGVFESEPIPKQFKTSYHFSFYVRLIFVPFAAVMPGVAKFILKKKLEQINNDENEENNPVYAEAQPPEEKA